MARDLTSDGHVLVVEADGPHPEDGDIGRSIVCPADLGGKCTGPYVTCSECDGRATIYDDEDREQPCPACVGTGMADGQRQCYLKLYGLDYAEVDVLHGGIEYALGRFELLYTWDGWHDDFEAELLRGAPLASPDPEQPRDAS